MSAEHLSIPVPQDADVDAVAASLGLPAVTADALARARGALVRTAHRLERDGQVVWALGIHRPHTAQEKLFAWSGDPALLGELTRLVADQVRAAEGIGVKVEVPAAPWAAAAVAAGLTRLAAPVSPGPPPVDPVLVPEGFVVRLGGWSRPEVSYFRQTTDFTCGPVASLMGLQAVGRRGVPDRAEELRLWRDATSMPACDVDGLTAALADRGVVTEAVVSQTTPLEIEPHPAEWLRDLREVVHRDFWDRSVAAGVRLEVGEVSAARVLAEVGAGRVVVLLIDELAMHGEACAHWVLVHGEAGGVALVEDPWTDADLGESWVDAHELPVTPDGLDAMIGWGDHRAMIVLGRG